MHPNTTFRKTSQDDAIAFARQRGFGIVAINGPDGEPLAAHIPFTITSDALHVHAHLVASNPLLRALSDGPCKALISISGPDSYVSPDWYQLNDQVPTWNYVAVNIRGTLSAAPIEDLGPYLEELSETFEARLAPKPIWNMAKVDTDILARMMRQIRPVHLLIEQVESTYKLGQNKPDAARIAAAHRVAQDGIGQETDALADWMKGAG